jgi:alpha-L-rhamnosidase
MNRREFTKKGLFASLGTFALPYAGILYGRTNRGVEATVSGNWNKDSVAGAANAQMAEGRYGVFDLRTDTRVDPLGVEPHHLQFSWRIQNADFQGGWQIQVASSENFLHQGKPDLWDTGWCTGIDTSRIAYKGTPLKSSQQAWWRVRSRDHNGNESDWSVPACFEMGLLDPIDWQGAAWIGCTREMHLPEMAPRDVMGDWISGPDGTSPDAFYVSFSIPDIPVTSAMAYWGVSRPGITAIASIEGRILPGQRDRVSHVNRGFVDLSFQLHPGHDNLLRLDLQGDSEDVAVCFGMRVVFADGRDQLISSGEGNWTMIHQGEQTASVAKVCAYGEAPYGEASVFPRQQLAPAWFKTTVPVNTSLVKARLYICALGHGKTMINGKAVTDAQLTPPQTDYEDHAMYDSHDVTALLQTGDNALAVLLDPGWYDQVGGFGTIMSYGRPGLKALLRLEYADGQNEFFTSGDSWHYKVGGLQAANTYLGERVDYRLDHDEWKQLATGAGWNQVQVLEPLSPKLIPVDLPPMRRLREIKPVQKWKIGEKTWLYDLGENITGWIRLAFHEPQGSVVRIRYAEMADNGKIWDTPLSHWWCHGSVQRDDLISDGQPRVYETSFAYKGFRYFEICGLSREPGDREVVAFEVCTDAPMTATFESSDPLLNRLFDNGRRSHYGNMVNSLVDCPHREKCLWGGDLHSSWAFGFHGIDSATYYRHQVRLGYTGPVAPGGIPGNVMVGKRITSSSSSFNWSVSPLFITWWLYQHEGDIQAVKEYYEPMHRFLLYFHEHANNGVPHLTRLADHAPPEGIKREPPNNELISALNFFVAARRFGHMALAIDKTADADWAFGVAETARDAVMRFYRRDEHTFGNGTQDSLALAFEVMSDAEENQRLAASLANHYRNNGHQFDGGFMSYWIYPMLSRYGYGDDALKMMRNTDYPGPAWSIERYDATTFWEMFTFDTVAQFQRSLNHHAINHPAAWLLTDLAGIRLDNTRPGGRHLILEPSVPGGEQLEWVSASMLTRHGKVESAWKTEGRTVTWEFAIPPNCEAKLNPPSSALMERISVNGKQELNKKDPSIAFPGRYRMQWNITG